MPFAKVLTLKTVFTIMPECIKPYPETIICYTGKPKLKLAARRFHKSKKKKTAINRHNFILSHFFAIVLKFEFHLFREQMRAFMYMFHQMDDCRKIAPHHLYSLGLQENWSVARTVASSFRFCQKRRTITNFDVVLPNFLLQKQPCVCLSVCLSLVRTDCLFALDIAVYTAGYGGIKVASASKAKCISLVAINEKKIFRMIGRKKKIIDRKVPSDNTIIN